MATIICPHCGKEIKITASAGSQDHIKPVRGLMQSSQRSAFHAMAGAVEPPAGIPAGYEAERRRGAFMPTLESNVQVPGCQALVSGIFAGVAVGTMIGSVSYLGGLTFWQATGAGTVTTIITTFATSWWQWRDTSSFYNDLLWQVERVTNTDINQDGRVGKSEPVKHEVDAKTNEGNHTIIDLFTDQEHPEVVYKFIQAVADGRVEFSERGAVKIGYSAELFKLLRDEFITRGVAYWKHPRERRQGVGFTTAGRALLRELARLPYPAG